jgi:hypothetical protein
MQVERNLDFVTERVEEMKGLADQGEEIPGEVMVRMEAQMDLAVGYTIVAPREKAPALVEELGRRMIQQQQVLERIKAEGTQKEEGGALALESALELAKRVMLAAELSEGDPLRMQNEYQMLAEPAVAEPAEPAEPQNQNREGMSDSEAAPEPEGPQSQHSDQNGAAGANSPNNEGNSPSESPGKQNKPDSKSLEDPAGPAGSSDLAASSNAKAAPANSAKASQPGKTAAAAAEAPKGKSH